MPKSRSIGPFFVIYVWTDHCNPFNWSPAHSTGPQSIQLVPKFQYWLVHCQNGQGEQECGRDVRKNGISQQPMNENGIRFLRQERFWNLLLLEEGKIEFTLFLTV